MYHITEGPIFNETSISNPRVDVSYANPKEGWRCPSCGSIISPTVQMCPKCKGGKTVEGLKAGDKLIYS